MSPVQIDMKNSFVRSGIWSRDPGETKGSVMSIVVDIIDLAVEPVTSNEIVGARFLSRSEASEHPIQTDEPAALELVASVTFVSNGDRIGQGVGPVAVTHERIVGMCHDGQIGDTRLAASDSDPTVAAWQLKFEDVSEMSIGYKKKFGGRRVAKVIVVSVDAGTALLFDMVFHWSSSGRPAESKDLAGDAETIGRIISASRGTAAEWFADGDQLRKLSLDV